MKGSECESEGLSVWYLPSISPHRTVGKPRLHGGSSSRSAYRELIIGRINKLSQLQASIRLSSLDMASGSLEDTDRADRQISGGRRACIHGNDCEFLHEVTSNSVSICYFDCVRPLNMKIRPVSRLHRKPYRLSQLCCLKYHIALPW